MKHQGTKRLETARLVLRRFTLDDAQAMYDNWASDPEVTKFLTWPPHANPEVTKVVLEGWAAGYEKDDFYQWAIVLEAEGDRPIGSISVVHLDDNVGSCEIGYCIGRRWWHRGIMTEALGAVMDFLFTDVGIERVEARYDPNNLHSGGVMGNCGMTYEGTLRRAGRSNQGICDLCVYGILRGEWERRRTQHYMAGYTPADDEDLVQEIYRRYDEDHRLNRSKAAQVEFLTNVRYIQRYLKPGARVLDIGAGAGEYSLYFSRQGYAVSALELAESNLEAFRKKLTPEDAVELVQGNALDLCRYTDDSFDAVLLFGPLYHLHSDGEKLRCIAEAKRVCKPGGKLFCAFIANDMVILTMFQEHPEYFRAGDYDKETFRLDDFPFVFHTVERCRELLRQGGVRVIHEVASDGVSELLQHKINAMDESSYAQYLRYHEYICEKPECLGMSNHLLFVGEK